MDSAAVVAAAMVTVTTSISAAEVAVARVAARTAVATAAPGDANSAAVPRCRPTATTVAVATVTVLRVQPSLPNFARRHVATVATFNAVAVAAAAVARFPPSGGLRSPR